MSCIKQSQVSLTVGKTTITNILHHLNQNLFNECFKNHEITYKELHPISNQIFSIFLENKFPSSTSKNNTPSNLPRRRSPYLAFGKLYIDEISFCLNNNTSPNLSESDHLKIVCLLYCIIFSHFIESQIKSHSYKDTISALEDKIQVLKDQMEREIGTKNILENELLLTRKSVLDKQKLVEIAAVRTIQKYWKRHIGYI